MAVTNDIVQAHIRPRVVMQRLLDMGQREDRALALLMISCVLMFVLRLPTLVRDAHINGTDLSADLAYAFMGGVMFLPLMLYAVAAVLHICARIVGGKGTFYTARLALFWSFLASMPLAVFWALLRGLNGNVAGTQIIAWLGTLVFAWIFVNSFWVAERR